MRTAARVDVNQAAIVESLRGVGATVQPLHTVGKGCPDLLVGFRENNYLLEVKNGRLVSSRRKLTPDEVEWHASWAGCVHVVNDETEALTVIGAI
jgi:hypothetical protein